MEGSDAELLSSADINLLPAVPVVGSTEYMHPLDTNDSKQEVKQEVKPTGEDEHGDQSNPSDGTTEYREIPDNAVRFFLMSKFTIYETKTRMYIFGSNSRESRFRALEIDTTVEKDKLEIFETSELPYTRNEIMNVLAGIEEESKSTGGLSKRLTAYGIIGFIRFTEGYYLQVVTKRSVVAVIGGHYVYHIDGTELVPLANLNVYKRPDRRSEEARFISTLQNLDLSKTFYYSYTYDITHTLQHNLIREKETALGIYESTLTLDSYNEMFVWNHSLIQPALACFERALDWCVPIIHGFIDQAKISVSGKSILVTIIARRSHYFAGARFLKRGVNDQGNVANEVETEQIVTDLLTSSFHDPKDGLYNNPRYTSYVQHRGSIPLYWSQDVSSMSPKPPIELNSIDPFYSSAALHFDGMFERYGRPVMVLNLIKQRERVPRETKLLREFEQCIEYLNQFLSEDARIDYTAWDMSRASKGRNQEVIDFLETYAVKVLTSTGFFHNGVGLSGLKIQDGICRTNCIDCLDRTNAAQFVIGKRALGYQLHALGIIEDPNLEYDSDAVNLLTEMFHDHGDTIALQYGGSHLVNTMETYRQINQWSSHSRDLIESIRRFYSNSFVDSQRQDAINLFLGNYVWEKGQPMLWDLPTDYYLHNDFSSGLKNNRRSYCKWWVPQSLETLHSRLQHQIDKLPEGEEERINRSSLEAYRGFFDTYWNEHYKPRSLTAFHTAFSYNLNSTSRYTPAGETPEESALIGPFKSRKSLSRQHRLKGNSNGSSDDKEKVMVKRNERKEDSMRKEAMKRASNKYKPQKGIPTLIYDKIFMNKVGSQSSLSLDSNNSVVDDTESLLIPSLDEIDDEEHKEHEKVEFSYRHHPSRQLNKVDDYSDAEEMISFKDHEHDLVNEYERYAELQPWSNVVDVGQHPEYGNYVEFLAKDLALDRINKVEELEDVHGFFKAPYEYSEEEEEEEQEQEQEKEEEYNIDIERLLEVDSDPLNDREYYEQWLRV